MNTQNTSDSGHAKSLPAKDRAGLSGAAGSATPKASVHARPPFGGGGGRERSAQRLPLPPPAGSTGVGAGAGGESGVGGGGGGACGKAGGMRKAATSRSLSVGSRFGARKLGADGENDGESGNASGLERERGGKVRVGGGPAARPCPAGAGTRKPPMIPRSLSASSARGVGSGAVKGAALSSHRGGAGKTKEEEQDDEDDEEERGEEHLEDAEDEKENGLAEPAGGNYSVRDAEVGGEGGGAGSLASTRSARAGDPDGLGGQDEKPLSLHNVAAGTGGARNARKPPLGASSNVHARPRVGVGRGPCVAQAGGHVVEDKEMICHTRGAGGTPEVDRPGGEVGKEARGVGGGEGGGGGAGSACWDNRGPMFGEKVGPGMNGFRLVFPFDHESSQLAGAAERKAGPKGNVDIRAIVELIKQSDAKFRKDVRAAGKKLVNAALSESAPGGERISGGMPGVLGLRRSGVSKPSAEPWWMAPGPIQRPDPSPCVEIGS